jgi:carbamoyltransferase
LSIILGISAFYHDSAAALIINGEIIAAAQEERFTRIKNTSAFPINAIKFCLKEAKIDIEQIEIIAFYEKPKLKFKRFIKNHIESFPFGIKQFIYGIHDWVYTNSKNEKTILNQIEKFFNKKLNIKVLFSEHHLSHAASSYFCSNFNESAILIIDGVGEIATTTIFKANGKEIYKIKEIEYPDSLGLLYSSFTYFLGFKINSGEYKLMGLASYGNIKDENTLNYIKNIKENLIKVKNDGSFKLNLKYFNFHQGFSMINEKLWENLFGIKKRNEDNKIEQYHCDLALAIQNVIEDVILKIIKEIKIVTKSENLCLAGGVALNCVANGKILDSDVFKNLYIQPASGDAGGSIGAALAINYIYNDNAREINNNIDKISGAFLGPKYEYQEIIQMINENNAQYDYHKNFDDIIKIAATLIDQGNIIGWFQGKMEFGPRALGNRSIIADPRALEMQKKLNLSIKKREGFRPFAPSVLESKAGYYFKLKQKSNYMQFVAPITDNIAIQLPNNYDRLDLRGKLYTNKSLLPAITHVDFSARIQTVSKENNEKFWALLQYLDTNYNLAVVINTSFNVRGEPIVCDPQDAYNCFINTDIDYLIIENFIFNKKDQLKNNNLNNEQIKFELD